MSFAPGQQLRPSPLTDLRPVPEEGSAVRGFVRQTTRLGLAVILAVMVLTGFSPSARGQQVVRRFNATDELFANPGQGWMTMQRMPQAQGQGRFPYSLAYFRLSWDELEPTEGQYNWRLIDEAAAAWAKHGVTVAFRVMATSSHSHGYYCSPKWLFDAGCRSFEYLEGGGDETSGGTRIPRVEPDYGDPLFLKKHGQFIQALAQHCDGNPALEFIDIGSYGMWGEWHTKHPQPWPIRKQIIDMYLSGFRKTQLVTMSDDAEALAYTLPRGTGFRRDGVGSPWHEANWIGSQKYAAVPGFADQWQRAPVVFEWFGSYDYLKQRGWSLDRALQFMKANHVTFINDNIGQVPADGMPKLQELARLAGYRFVLRQIAHVGNIVRGKPLMVSMLWSNVGVGKMNRRLPLALFLLDGDGNVAAQEVQTRVDPTTWLPGDLTVKATLKVPRTLPAGKYTLGLAFIDPVTEKPAVQLAIDAPQTDRLYRLSQVNRR